MSCSHWATTQRHTNILGRPDAFYKQFSQEVVQVRLSFLYNLPTYLSTRMLEDPVFQSVVSWGPQGDCFVVKACPWWRYQRLDSYPYSVGHERVHQVHSTSQVQAFQLCQFRPTIEQVRFPQGQKY